jgi:hypothetical protein
MREPGRVVRGAQTRNQLAAVAVVDEALLAMHTHVASAARR